MAVNNDECCNIRRRNPRNHSIIPQIFARIHPHQTQYWQAHLRFTPGTSYGVRPRDLDPVLVQSVLLASGDTLHITPFLDVTKAGLEWPAIQLVTVRGLMQLTNSHFSPGAAFTSRDLAKVVKKLFNREVNPDDPLSRAALADTVRPLMAGDRVSFIATSEIPRADAPVSRLEAAQIFAGFLKERAVARLMKQSRDLTWPAIQQPSPLALDDMSTGLAANIKVLVDHGIIPSPDYWTARAASGSDYDGAQVAGLLKALAQTMQPGSPEARYIEICVANEVINSPSYWREHAMPGGQCSAAFTASIIERAALKLRFP